MENQIIIQIMKQFIFFGIFFEIFNTFTEIYSKYNITNRYIAPEIKLILLGLLTYFLHFIL
jgi:hypothetical protein